MSLEDLNFKIGADISDALEALQKLLSWRERLTQDFQNIDLFKALNTQLHQAFGDTKLIDYTRVALNSTENSVARLNDQLRRLVSKHELTIVALELKNQATRADTLRKIWSQTRTEMVRFEGAARRAVSAQREVIDVAFKKLPDPAPRQNLERGVIVSGQPRQRGGGIIKAAETIVQLNATMGLAKASRSLSTTMREVGGTMAKVRQSVLAITDSNMVAASAMDRFRLAATAPKVDPSLNLLKTGVDKVSDSMAGLIDKARGIADASIEGIPDTLNGIAKGGAKVSAELDKTSASMSKHISRGQVMSRGLGLLNVATLGLARNAINPLRDVVDAATAKLETGAQRVESMSAVVNSAANKARNAQYVLTGTFEQLGGSADQFARANFHAMLPARLLKREIEGSMRIVRAATHVWNFATHPIHAVAMAVSRGRAEFRTFRATLPQLTGGLQLGVRGYRAFAHATYLTSSALRPLAPLARLAGTAAAATARSIWNIVSPSKAASAALGTVASAAKTTATSLAAVASPSRVASAGFSGLVSKAGMVKTAMAAGAAGMIALGTSTAMATEKNNAVFGTMLHDLQQGKAVVKSLQTTQAAKFFDNEELLDSGRLLFKAGVSAKDLAGKTEQFAKISAATSTELADLTRIYQQGANSGSFGQDKINQYAERGIAIYEGLQHATGKSGAALKSMISDGKIGVAEMDAALAHLTDGHGIYADSLNNLAGTTAGKMSILKNNVSQALGSVMGVALEILQPFGAAIVTLSEQLKTTFDSFRPYVIYGATAVAWFFQNFLDLGQFAFYSVSAGAVTMFNDIAYWLTDRMPAYVMWFGENWTSIFGDIASGTMTVFTNLAANIGSAMREIWNYIKSGGTDALEFAWTPLLDGFKSTVSQLPDIPDRAMTELEKSLNAKTEQLRSNLATSFDAMLADANQRMGNELPEIKDTGSRTADPSEKAKKDASARAVANKAALVRSEEGQSVVAQLTRAIGKDDDKKKQTKSLATAAEKLTSIEREVRDGTRLVGKAFA